VIDGSLKSPNATSKYKLPPHSIDAEQAVLGGLMLDNKAWDNIADRVVEKHFYRRDHQLIFRAMVKLMEESKPIDVITVSEELVKMEVHNEVGGLSYAFFHINGVTIK